MFKEYVEKYGARFQYPEEATAALAEVAAGIEADAEMCALFTECYEKYCSDHTHTTVFGIYNTVKEKSLAYSAPQESVQLLIFILLSHHLEELYEQNNLPDRYFDGVMADLRAKLVECKTIKNVWGSFVSDWFISFFTLDRFAIGRLQYNFVKLPACETLDGKYRFEGGEWVLTIHIPSTGPLLHDDIEASLQEAATFYADKFDGDYVIFNCDTWLLYSGHEEMLPETSNVRRFRDHFSMCADVIDPAFKDMWRVFGNYTLDDIGKLPRNTGLQRAYADWLEQGKPVGKARGIRYIKKPR